MAQIEVTIDSVRLSLMSGEWVVGLKEKGHRTISTYLHGTEPG
ncbi:unnamed protein product, partial [marine sediment metagenome]